MTVVLIGILACGIAAVGTGFVRQYSLSRHVMDMPNERSSHTRPTPRGGGAAIVAGVLLSVALLWSVGAIAADAALAVLGAGTAVAAVGFIDDHQPVPARMRLAVHFVAAGWVLYCFRLPPAWNALNAGRLIDALGYVVAAFVLVWLLNLYNFMDGIDGLAATEAVTACFGAVAITASTNDVSSLALVLGAAALGFLVWNFPPARIFMGDVGSGFLGLMVGIMALGELERSIEAGAAWLILLAVFITDASLTLLRRWQRGAPLASAHRTHAYQHAAAAWRSHRRVTLLVAAVNLFWLLPLAFLVDRGTIPPLVGLAAAFLPLVGAAWRLGAGVPQAVS